MGQTVQPEILFLSQGQVQEAGALDMGDCIRKMESVFKLYNQNKTVLGECGQDLHGHMTTFPSSLSDPECDRLRAGSRFGAMPAYVGGGIDIVGVKWYGSVTPRAEENNAPWSSPLLVLSDPDSGQILAIMDGEIISSMRTGAMAALGAKHTNRDPSVVTVLGPGAIGQTSALALDTLFSSLDQLRIYHPNIQKSNIFKDRMSEQIQVNIHEYDDLEDAVRDSDIVVAAASRNPVLEINTSWLASNSTVIQLGDLQIDLHNYKPDHVICDIRRHPIQFHRQVGWKFTESFVNLFGGELNNELAHVGALHEVVNGKTQPPTSGKTIFSSLGLPIEDIAWGAHVYENAISSGLGQPLSMSDGPYFKKPMVN